MIFIQTAKSNEEGKKELIAVSSFLFVMFS